MIDIAIIGAGPAGLSAAINSVIRNKKVKVFGNPPSTSYLYKAERVDNYIGMLGMNGKDMMTEFINHAKEMGVSIQTSKVIEVFPIEDYYMLNVDNEWIESKTIIFASGLSKDNPLEGEETFLGKGVSYCATCDGPLYRGRNVAVIGDSSHAEEEVNYLSEVCKSVYYIPLYKEIMNLNARVEMIFEKPKKILGQQTVTHLVLEGSQLEVSGVFIIKQNLPAVKMLKSKRSLCCGRLHWEAVPSCKSSWGRQYCCFTSCKLFALFKKIKFIGA